VHERLAGLLADRDRVVAALADLPGPCLVLLELLVETPDHGLPYALCRREVERRLGVARQGEVALAGLSGTGLLLNPGAGASDETRWALLPGPLAAALRPYVMGLGAKPVDAGTVTVTRPGDATPLELAVALLCGELERDPPKITQAGWLYQTALDKLARVYYPADAPPGRRLRAALTIAQMEGLLALAPGLIRVRRAAVGGYAAAHPAGSGAARLAAARAGLGPDERRLFDRLLGAPAGSWLRRADLTSFATVQRHAVAHAYWHPGLSWDARHDSEWRDDHARQSVKLLCDCPEVELGRLPDGAEVARLAPGLRAAPARGIAPARAYVQPSFEVILPPDVPFAIAVDIARIAEVRRVEDVATLALSATSVAQARRAGLTAAEILAIPERLAPGAVPQNVAATLAEWARIPSPARLIATAVLVCTDPTVAARVRVAPAVRGWLGDELAPGVFAVQYDDFDDVRRALRTARIDAVVAAPQGRGDDCADTDGRAASLAETLRAQLAALAEAAEASPPPALLRAVEEVRAGSKVWTATPRPAGTGAAGPVRAPASPSRHAPPAPPLDELVDDTAEDEGAPPYDYESLVWYAPPPGPALEVLLAEMARLELDAGFEIRGPEGRLARLTILVERVATRRGLAFLEGSCYDADEDVAIPLPAIERIGVPAIASANLTAFLAALAPQIPSRATPKVGRNDPCPCGSGRKYKRCCGG
jgi:hypothetical protein